MKQLTRLASLVLAGSLWFGASLATAGEKAGQGAPQGDRREVVENRLRALDEHLNLTQGQQIKIRLILVNMVAQANAIRDNKSLTPQQKMRRAQATREAAYDKIAAELTPQQRVKFNKHRAQLAGVGDKGNHGGNNGGGKGDGNKGDGNKGDGNKGDGNHGGGGKGNKGDGNKGGPERGNRDRGNKGKRGPRISPR